MSLTFLVALLAAMSAIGVHQVHCQRLMTTGEPCVLPFVFNVRPRLAFMVGIYVRVQGEVFTDCMPFGGREWCYSEEGEWGACAFSNATDAAPEVISGAAAGSIAPERNETGRREAVQEGSCCGLLREVGFESELPVMVVDTAGDEIPDEPKVGGRLCTCLPVGEAEGGMHLIGVEIRGSTSARDFLKKSYGIETRDDDGEDLDVSLFGFPNGSDWVLYGPELDKSMGMRNFLTMELYRSSGSYASRTQYIELFLVNDGRPLSMRHYNGVYIFMEKIKRGEDRVTIDKLSADEDISGGYIFKYDNNNFDPGDQIFNSTESSLRFIVTYPGKEKVTPSSLQYLSSYIGEVEVALATENRTVWEKYIDEASFVDMFLLTELTKNPDGYRGSYYFHKNPGNVLIAGPPWDFNEAYGMCCGYPIEGYLNNGVSDGLSGGSAISTDGWRFNICVQRRRCIVDPTDGVSFWFRHLMEDPQFLERVRARWTDLRSGPWSTENVTSHFAFVLRDIAAPVTRNFERWSDELREIDLEVNSVVWRQEMTSMQEWTIARLEWLDSVLVTPPLPSRAVSG